MKYKSLWILGTSLVLVVVGRYGADANSLLSENIPPAENTPLTPTSVPSENTPPIPTSVPSENIPLIPTSVPSENTPLTPTTIPSENNLPRLTFPLPKTPQVPKASKAKARVSSLSYEIRTYNSQIMGGKRTYGIVLPPGYWRQPYQYYPVIFLLHGGHGGPTSWFEFGNALPIIQKLYAEGKLMPSIIITPDGNDSRGSNPSFDPAYIDGPYGNVNTGIGQELVNVIKSYYRTLPTPTFWAIGGLSSGGWGAVNVGLHHLNHFSTLFSHSGFFRDASGAENSPMDYVRMLPNSNYQQLRIYLDAGEADGQFLRQTRQFHNVLEQLNINNVFYTFPGGHGTRGADAGWNYWHKHLADSLTYVGEQFRIAQLNQSNPKITSVTSNP